MLTRDESWALDRVEDRLQKGWTQGDYGAVESDDGPVCLSGAVGSVYYCNRHRDVCVSAAATSLGIKLGNWFITRHHHTIPSFNDHVAKSVEDVLLELKKFREEEGEEC